MATAAPPPPAASTPPPARRPLRPAAPRPLLGRILPLAALVAVIVLVLVLVLSRNSGADYGIVFADASQLVKGDEVEVGGSRVGTVTGIELNRNYRARVTIHIDSSLVPLHEGTTAEIRVPSLSSVANRYVALSPGPNNRRALRAGAIVPGAGSKETVDLDQLFNTLNPKTRKGLSDFIQASAEQYSGAGSDLRTATRYFPPSLAAVDHVFTELAHDQPLLTNFLVETAKATTTIAARRQQLSELIGNANTAFGALAAEQSNLGRGLHALPGAVEEGNRAFEKLPATLAALRRLVDVSKPNTTTLARFFAALRPLLQAATPVVGNLHEAFQRPGANNDLTEAALALPSLAKTLQSASPHGVRALEESLPVTAMFGPYTPDLVGLVRDFGQADAYYDANGHYARTSGLFPDFALEENEVLKPASPERVLSALKTGQLRRCPGSGTQPAEDGSSPFAGEGQFGCDPTQVPPR